MCFSKRSAKTFMNQKGFGAIFLVCIVLLVMLAGFFGLQLLKNNEVENFQIENVTKSKGKNNPFSKRYSAGKCVGEGTTTFTYSPMKIEDIGSVEPYGIMVDAHVIPTSHGYISPL